VRQVERRFAGVIRDLRKKGYGYTDDKSETAAVAKKGVPVGGRMNGNLGVQERGPEVRVKARLVKRICGRTVKGGDG
jgi:hypothetical protein